MAHDKTPVAHTAGSPSAGDAFDNEAERAAANNTKEVFQDSVVDRSEVNVAENLLILRKQFEALSETDCSSERSCRSECSCWRSDSSNTSIHTEFDVVSTSSYNISGEDNSSDYSSIIDIEITNSVTNKTTPEIDDKTKPDIEDGYLPDDSDMIQVKTPKIILPPTACFKTCVQCKSENPDPYFQYCHPCFRKRMELFEKKPTKKKKNNNKQKQMLFIEKKEKEDSNNINRMIEVPGTEKNLCNICFMLPKNSVFSHGKIGHIYCCYPCAKKIRGKTDKCPYCSVKFKFITKLITA